MSLPLRPGTVVWLRDRVIAMAEIPDERRSIGQSAGWLTDKRHFSTVLATQDRFVCVLSHDGRAGWFHLSVIEREGL